MSEPEERPRLREHLAEFRKALHDVGRDVELDVANAPHLTKEGAKNVIASAAGVRRKPMRAWSEPEAGTKSG
jgi:hypothetical protein